jgi:hypothetical protein
MKKKFITIVGKSAATFFAGNKDDNSTGTEHVVDSQVEEPADDTDTTDALNDIENDTDDTIVNNDDTTDTTSTEESTTDENSSSSDSALDFDFNDEDFSFDFDD